jgi:hypothetical protein
MQIQGVWLRSRPLTAFGADQRLHKNALWQYLTTAVPERSEISTIGQRRVLMIAALPWNPAKASRVSRPGWHNGDFNE